MLSRLRSTVRSRTAQFCVAAGALALALGAAAQTPPGANAPQPGPVPAHFAPPPGGPIADGVPPFLRGVELTEAQRDKIFALTHAQAPALREQFKALDKAQRELHALVFQGPYDEAKARALADAASRAQAEILFARARTDAQILQWLTPAQRKQLDEALASRPGDHERNRGHGGDERDQGPDGRAPMPPHA